MMRAPKWWTNHGSWDIVPSSPFQKKTNLEILFAIPSPNIWPTHSPPAWSRVILPSRAAEKSPQARDLRAGETDWSVFGEWSLPRKCTETCNLFSNTCSSCGARLTLELDTETVLPSSPQTEDVVAVSYQEILAGDTTPPGGNFSRKQRIQIDLLR
jgi:hypothetical protein